MTKGFDFLGYIFKTGRKLRPFKVCLKRFAVCARQLYEQGVNYNRLRQYVALWVKYIHAELKGLVSRKGGSKRYLVFIVKQLQLVNQLIE